MSQTIQFDFGEVEYDVSVLGNVKIMRVRNLSGPDCAQKEVHFPNSINGQPLKSIDSGAFANFVCSELFLPQGVFLQVRSFEKSKIKKIHIPGVTAIPTECFKQCSLEELLDTDSVNFVGNNVFQMTDSLKHFSWFKSVHVIHKGSFEDSALESIDGIDDVYFFEACAFKHSCLKEITFSCKEKIYIERECFAYSPIRSIQGSCSTLTLPKSAIRGCKDVDVSSFDVVYVKSDTKEEFESELIGGFDTAIIQE